MAREKFRWITWWFFSLQITLYLLLFFVQGNEEADEAYRNGRNLVLEHFLPISLPVAVGVPTGREKRNSEGSGEEDTVFSEVSNVDTHLREEDNSTKNAFAFTLMKEHGGHKPTTMQTVEGSGEEDSGSHNSSTTEDEAQRAVIEKVEGEEDEDKEEKESEEVTTEATTPKEDTAEEESTVSDNHTTTERDSVIEQRFEKLEDLPEEVSSFKPEETTTVRAETPPTEIPLEAVTEEKLETEKPKLTQPEEITTIGLEELVDGVPTKSGAEPEEQSTTSTPQESTTVETETLPDVIPIIVNTEQISTTLPDTLTTVDINQFPAVIPKENISEESTSSVMPETVTTSNPLEDTTVNPIIIPSVKVSPVVPSVTEELPVDREPILTTRQPVIEPDFKQTKIAEKSVEALPENILQKEELSPDMDSSRIITNTMLMDSEETVQRSSAEPKRLGAYIVIGLILLSFSSLVGYITFKKRKNRKRLDFESNQESNDTEKALLSLSEYKDNSELEENHLKNNEIAPIVVKSNTQINKFEKNTNFSSPKNLNTVANEKNVEKDNVLKSTAENLTQVIIEGSPKDVEEDKNVPNMEKLIVTTRVDQDSIPKKPVIITKSSTGYLPIPQDSL